MLVIDDVHVAYGERSIVQGVSIRAAKGEVAALPGRNAVGKTTSIHAIAGLNPPRSGRIIMNGDDIAGLPAHEIARRGPGLVPQGRHVFPSLSVREHLAVGARGNKGRRWNPERVLELFPRLRERLHHRGGDLSGGEQEMLAIGRALVGNPDVILMDEPTEGLAPLLVRELGRILGGLKRGSVSILLVEQNLAFALRVADHAFIMNKGTIVRECAPGALRNDPVTKARYLGV